MTSSVLVQEKILVIIDLFYLDCFTLNIFFYLFLLDMINRKMSNYIPITCCNFWSISSGASLLIYLKNFDASLFFRKWLFRTLINLKSFLVNLPLLCFAYTDLTLQTKMFCSNSNSFHFSITVGTCWSKSALSVEV